MLPVATAFLYAKRWPLWIVYLLICAPWIFVIVFFEPDDKRTFYLFAILGSHLLFIFFYYAVIKMKISIYSESLLYENLFKTKELLWSEIISSQLSYDFDVHGGRVKWTFQTSTQNLSITPTFFSRKDNRLLAEALISKAKSAIVSESIVRLANGKVPWYLF